MVVDVAQYWLWQADNNKQQVGIKISLLQAH